MGFLYLWICLLWTLAGADRGLWLDGGLDLDGTELSKMYNTIRFFTFAVILAKGSRSTLLLGSSSIRLYYYYSVLAIVCWSHCLYS